MPQRWLKLQKRLGPANVFNPVVPDGEYVLDLRDGCDVAPIERAVCGGSDGSLESTLPSCALVPELATRLRLCPRPLSRLTRAHAPRAAAAPRGWWRSAS